MIDLATGFIVAALISPVPTFGTSLNNNIVKLLDQIIVKGQAPETIFVAYPHILNIDDWAMANKVKITSELGQFSLKNIGQIFELLLKEKLVYKILHKTDVPEISISNNNLKQIQVGNQLVVISNIKESSKDFVIQKIIFGLPYFTNNIKILFEQVLSDFNQNTEYQGFGED